MELQSVTMLSTMARRRIVFLLRGYMVLVLLFHFVPFVGSSRGAPDLPQSIRDEEPGPVQMSDRLSFQIKLHAFLLWGSVGFLMPVGILLIRMPTTGMLRSSSNRRMIFFYNHVIIQIAAVLLATAGAVLSIKNFENSFSNVHQRIGLALYGFIWLQPLVGFVRPQRGSRARAIWFVLHLMLGIGISVAGIVNVFIGLQTYHQRTGKDVRLWTVLFTAEISIIAFIFILQDRWDYIKKQGEEHGDEQQQMRRSGTTSFPNGGIQKEQR